MACERAQISLVARRDRDRLLEEVHTKEVIVRREIMRDVKVEGSRSHSKGLIPCSVSRSRALLLTFFAQESSCSLFYGKHLTSTIQISPAPPAFRLQN